MISNNDLNFVQYINKCLTERLADKPSVVFGQNVVAGSRISGLGANLDKQKNILALNTPNVENTLMGFGLGLMLNGTDSAYLMKQHDFALLGLDQLTNTVNVAKTYNLNASFLLVMVVVDSGFEGPQASLNNLDEFASLSRSPVHFLNSKNNIDKAFEDSNKPGLHIMVLSQKNMKSPLTDINSSTSKFASGDLIKCSNPTKNLIIYFGLDFDYLQEIQKEFKSINEEFDTLIIRVIGNDYRFENEEFNEYDSILVIDTSKSEVSYARNLSLDLLSSGKNVIYVGRKPSLTWSYVNSDKPEIQTTTILGIWREKKNGK
jgi:hypothetical protein